MLIKARAKCGTFAGFGQPEIANEEFRYEYQDQLSFAVHFQVLSRAVLPARHHIPKGTSTSASGLLLSDRRRRSVLTGSLGQSSCVRIDFFNRALSCLLWSCK